MAEEDHESQYDLKKSQKVIGKLYPVLLSADGSVIDGKHRLHADQSWATLKLEHIDTEEKKLAARLVANFHRRLVSFEEKAGWINQLARIFRDQGLKVEGSRHGRQGSNEIADKIVETTGIPRKTLIFYLSSEFKNEKMARSPEQHSHIFNESARDIVFNALAGRSPAWAQTVLIRFEAELKAQFLTNNQNQAPSQAVRIQPDQQAEDMVKNGKLIMTSGGMYMKAGTQNQFSLLKKKDCWEGAEPLPDLWSVFHQECPECICSQCKHSESCVERVRVGD